MSGNEIWEAAGTFLGQGIRAGIAEFYEAAERIFEKEGFREEMAGSVPSILVVDMGAVGDNVLTSSFLRELRSNCPQGYIVLVTSPIAYPLMELCPYVNEVLSFALPRFHRGGNPVVGTQEILGFCREHLWKRKFDICLIPVWGSAPTEMRLLSYLSGARRRWSFSDAVNDLYMPEPALLMEEKYLLTDAIVNPPELIHEADRYLYLLEAMGLEVQDKSLEVWLGASDMRRARELLGDFGVDGHLVALSTGAGFANRQYPTAQWLEALREIVEEGGRIVIVGGPKEAADGKFLKANLPLGTVLDLTGKTGMRESIAVISKTELFMGNDTGMMHAATACRCPVIVIYREAVDREEVCTGVCSEFRRFEPYRANYIALRPEHALEGCRDAICYGGCMSREAHCIKQVRPEEIVEAFRIMTGQAS